MSDEEEIVGKWMVSFCGTKGAWKWEYTFTANKNVTWRDPLNGINGAGTWLKQGKLININWFPSSTKESWYGNPIKPTGQKGYIDSSYGQGEFSAEKIVATPAAADDRDLNKYIDNFNFDGCKYDVNYKVPPDLSHEFSYILQLKFPDGVTMDFDFRQLEDRPLNDQAWRAAMDQAYVGPGGRLYPRIMAKATVPRLWKNRLAAIEMRDEAALDFFLVAHAGLAAVLSVPAMPVRPISEASFGGAKSTRTRTQGVTRPGAGGGKVVVTEQMIKDAVQDAPLKTQQKGGISIPRIQDYVDKLNKGEVPPPIKVDDGIIVDGNHRYIAGRIAGREAPIQQWSGGSPNRVVPWDELKISPEKW